jgi:hypothetical protein
LARGELETAGEPNGEGHHLAGQAGWEVVERLAGQDHLPGDSGVPPVGSQEQRAAPVGVHQGDGVEVECVQEVRDQMHLPGQREVGVRLHRLAMGAKREDGTQVGESRRKQRQHAVPHGVVHQQSVQQDHRWPGAGLLVLDDTSRHLDIPHLDLPARTMSLERLF